MKYTIVSDYKLTAESDINRLLSEGWELHGSPSVTIDVVTDELVYTQALIHKE